LQRAIPDTRTGRRSELVTLAQVTPITAPLVRGGIEMTEAVFQFKAINRRLNRQEQKAEFEEKNPTSELPSAYARACSAAVPFELPDLRGRVVSLTGGSCESVTLTTAQLPPFTPRIADLPSHGHEFIRVDRWVIDEIERITGISSIKI
jgi:hypothetical protein